MAEKRVLFLDGARIEAPTAAFLAGCLLGSDTPAGELPYLFCGNGSCRDCNLLVEGVEDVPSCRVLPAPRLSARGGEGAGAENALSRRLPVTAVGAPLAVDAAVVGAGDHGRAAALALRRNGFDPVLLEARAGGEEGVCFLRPVGVVEGRLVVYEEGWGRPLRARALVLATGHRDIYPAFPGAALPGVLPLDLLERYAALEMPYGRKLVLVGAGERAERLASRLLALGASSVEIVSEPARLTGVDGTHHVEQVRLTGGTTLVADTLAVSLRRTPALALAKALGCRTRYDRDRKLERLVVSEEGATTVDGVFAAPPGDLAGTAAARYLESLRA